MDMLSELMHFSADLSALFHEIRVGTKIKFFFAKKLAEPVTHFHKQGHHLIFYVWVKAGGNQLHPAQQINICLSFIAGADTNQSLVELNKFIIKRSDTAKIKQADF